MYRYIMAGILGIRLISSANAQGVEAQLQALQNRVAALQATVNTLQTSVNSVLTAVNGETLQPYQQFADAVCNGQGACVVSFPAVTAKTLILRAACGWQLPPNARTDFVSVRTQNNNPQLMVAFFQNPGLGNVGLYGFNAET
jgi:hypothetical protein